MSLIYLLLLIVKKLWEVTSLSISWVAQILIIPSCLLPVIKYYESSETAIQLTGFLCSYKVVISLPLGLQLLNLLWKVSNAYPSELLWLTYIAKVFTP